MYHLDSNILIGFLRGHLISAYELLMAAMQASSKYQQW